MLVDFGRVGECRVQAAATTGFVLCKINDIVTIKNNQSIVCIQQLMTNENSSVSVGTVAVTCVTVLILDK